ncbi:MAG TPA: M20/M25/M40 family metallo-hydrolase [Actinomycetes bacterium]|nr:M20/M25/M40 family metallo-hydrolase [Actinomycetes bacterium]
MSQDGNPETVQSDPTRDVVEFCQRLIRFDTSNHGDDPRSSEREAAEYVAGLLSGMGLHPELIEPAPGRTSVFARVEGADPSAPALLLHGHLDVVPADAADWTHPPFAAEIHEDNGVPMVWGRGAIDMKDMDAMILAVVRDRLITGRRCRRPLVLAFLADEEAGGRMGSHWLVENRPDLFEGVDVAVGEVGGFSFTVDEGLRLYLVETAEKGIAWMQLHAEGRAGHGSMVNNENAVTRLAEALARIGTFEFPITITPTVERLLSELRKALGMPADASPEEVVERLGPIAHMIGATLRHSAAPTMLKAGYKTNVIPGSATAVVDGRFLPGGRDEFLTFIDELLGPHITRTSLVDDIALEVPFEGPVVDAMVAALLEHDPGARAVPYTLSGGTDAKAFAQLGIKGYGFAPLRLPPSLAFADLFHGVDERVPVDALKFGARVLDRFLDLV